MKIETFPIIVVIVIIPLLMFLAVNNDATLQQETSIQNNSQEILQTMSHYAKEGYDEICITDGFTYCAIDVENWQIWRNYSTSEFILQKYQEFLDTGTNLPPMPEKMIKGIEKQGNFTIYHNHCAYTMEIEHKTAYSQSQTCVNSIQISFDDLTKQVIIDDKEFLITISTITKMQFYASDDFSQSEFESFFNSIQLPFDADILDDFKIDGFIESKKRLGHLLI